MDSGFFLKGFILGFSIAAPVGPIGVLCIRRTLNHGTVNGLMTGLGAATADSFYGLIAGLGIAVITSELIAYQWWIRLVGGLFLVYLGVRIFRSRVEEHCPSARAGNSAMAFASALFLTVTNPATILSFLAVFAGLGLTGETNYERIIELVAGVWTGSALWWLILSSSVSLVRGKMTPKRLAWVNRLSGTVILAFAMAAFASLAAP